MGPNDKDEEIRDDFWDVADKIIDGIMEDMGEEIDATYIDAEDEQ